MSRSVLATGCLLVTAGLVVFVWKASWLDLPIVPAEPDGLWQLEIDVAIRGRGETGSVQVAMPSQRPGQRLVGEWTSSDDLDLSIREEDDRRLAVWSGWMEGIRRVEAVFSLERYETPTPSADLDPGAPPRPVARANTRPTMTIPATAPEIRDLVEELALPGPEDRAGRIRMVYAFVRHEVAGSPVATDDAVLCGVQREGSERGRLRLFVALLRAIGIPARLVVGLDLREGRAVPRVWSEVWWDSGWLPVSPAAGFFGDLPLDWIALATGDRPLVESAGVRGVSFSARAVRQHLTAEEYNAMMLPAVPLLEELSLYRLSVSAQAALRILLVMPLAALVVSLLRNVVGLPSYGTFMPVLIAMALRGTGLGLGLAMVAALVGVGVCGRMLLDRLQLLVVPRLSILLSVVVLGVAGFALLGRSLDERDFYAGIVFPIVILAMLVERISIVLAEEGLQEALVRTAGSVTIALAAYPLFRTSFVEHLVFGFPELILCVIGVLVWLGGYTGYRFTDWLRFHALAPDDRSATA